MTFRLRDLAISEEHQVLTLQTGKLSWRIKFSFVKVREPSIRSLMNFNGKLASVMPNADLHCFKMTVLNEVVLSEYYLRSPFYVFYYSLERETIRRVEIQGMEVFMHFQVYTFVDHVENVKLMKGGLGLALK
ncbi:unnamed protein product [Brassica rapa subsp. narinosa]